VAKVRVSVVRARKVRTDSSGQVLAAYAPAEKESAILAKIKLAVGTAGGVHVMRNNVGSAKMRGFWVAFGLEKGSSDLVAIVAPYGRWLCIEVKKPKGSRFEEGQREWLAKMERYGAVAGAVSTVAEALELVARARRPAFEDEVA
jgi:hypothetical protein